MKWYVGCWKLLVAVLSAIIVTFSFNRTGVKHLHHGATKLYDSTYGCKYINGSEQYPYPYSSSQTKHGENRYEEYKCGGDPYKITQEDIQKSDNVSLTIRLEVINAMKHIWKNYKEFAWGMDELHPISKRSTNNWGGMSATMIDALDTLWLMGMQDEFWEARNWISDNLSFDHIGEVSQFETTIRILGGLLSAYDLGNDVVFQKKANELGQRLMKAFDSPNGLPFGVVNLHTGSSHNFKRNGFDYLLAEVGTNQLEYRYLSNATGNPKFERKSMHAFDILEQIMPKDGLLPLKLKDGETGVEFNTDHISYGGMGDSTYEYMLKLWLQGGQKEQRYRDMWDKSVQGMHEQLLQRSKNGLTYIAEKKGGHLVHRMEHLTCFMGGALALGAYTDQQGLDSFRAKRDLKTAKALTYTCYHLYARTKTGIAPEYVLFEGDDDFRIPRSARSYILRPEVVESFYYLNKLTGDPIYREWGWELFVSIQKCCKVQYGYASLKDVNDEHSVEDRMESFFLAETLKYLYLLFDPYSNIDPLHTHIFNTEAHPLRIFG